MNKIILGILIAFTILPNNYLYIRNKIEETTNEVSTKATEQEETASAEVFVGNELQQGIAAKTKLDRIKEEIADSCQIGGPIVECAVPEMILGATTGYTSEEILAWQKVISAAEANPADAKLQEAKEEVFKHIVDSFGVGVAVGLSGGRPDLRGLGYPLVKPRAEEILALPTTGEPSIRYLTLTFNNHGKAIDKEGRTGLYGGFEIMPVAIDSPFPVYDAIGRENGGKFYNDIDPNPDPEWKDKGYWLGETGLGDGRASYNFNRIAVMAHNIELKTVEEAEEVVASTYSGDLTLMGEKLNTIQAKLDDGITHEVDVTKFWRKKDPNLMVDRYQGVLDYIPDAMRNGEKGAERIYIEFASPFPAAGIAGIGRAVDPFGDYALARVPNVVVYGYKNSPQYTPYSAEYNTKYGMGSIADDLSWTWDEYQEIINMNKEEALDKLTADTDFQRWDNNVGTTVMDGIGRIFDIRKGFVSDDTPLRVKGQPNNPIDPGESIFDGTLSEGDNEVTILGYDHNPNKHTPYLDHGVYVGEIKNDTRTKINIHIGPNPEKMQAHDFAIQVGEELSHDKIIKLAGVEATTEDGTPIAPSGISYAIENEADMATKKGTYKITFTAEQTNNTLTRSITVYDVVTDKNAQGYQLAANNQYIRKDLITDEALKKGAKVTTYNADGQQEADDYIIDGVKKETGVYDATYTSEKTGISIQAKVHVMDVMATGEDGAVTMFANNFTLPVEGLTWEAIDAATQVVSLDANGNVNTADAQRMAPTKLPTEAGNETVTYRSKLNKKVEVVVNGLFSKKPQVLKIVADPAVVSIEMVTENTNWLDKVAVIDVEENMKLDDVKIVYELDFSNYDINRREGIIIAIYSLPKTSITEKRTYIVGANSSNKKYALFADNFELRRGQVAQGKERQKAQVLDASRAYAIEVDRPEKRFVPKVNLGAYSSIEGVHKIEFMYGHGVDEVSTFISGVVNKGLPPILDVGQQEVITHDNIESIDWLLGVTARDDSDGDITGQVEILDFNLKDYNHTTKSGTVHVTYGVEDSDFNNVSAQRKYIFETDKESPQPPGERPSPPKEPDLPIVPPDGDVPDEVNNSYRLLAHGAKMYYTNFVSMLNNEERESLLINEIEAKVVEEGSSSPVECEIFVQTPVAELTRRTHSQTLVKNIEAEKQVPVVRIGNNQETNNLGIPEIKSDELQIVNNRDADKRNSIVIPMITLFVGLAVTIFIGTIIANRKSNKNL